MEKDIFYIPTIKRSCIEINTTKSPFRDLGHELAMKYNQHNLDKIERIAEECGYIIRYERGTFQSGYCILQAKKIIVVNKFFQAEGRINTLIELMPQLDINYDALTLESQKMYDEVMSSVAEK